MKKLIVVVFLGIAALNGFPQMGDKIVDFAKFGSAITGSGYLDRSVMHDLIHELEKANRYKTPEELNQAILSRIEGSPFMNDEFILGEIITTDDENIKDVQLRFNIFNNKMEAKFNETLFELSDDRIKRINFDNRTFDYLTYRIFEKESAGYLELIQDGPWKLYCLYSKKFKVAQAQKAMQDKPSPAQFRDLPVIYLLKNDENEQIVAFKSKKELLEIVGKQNRQIQDFMNVNKMKTNNPEDLKSVIVYLNSL